jgi:hypothetical protein
LAKQVLSKELGLELLTFRHYILQSVCQAWRYGVFGPRRQEFRSVARNETKKLAPAKISVTQN